MKSYFAGWTFWALASAAFAALTAVFAKLGVTSIPSDMATLVRTVVILAVTGAIVAATGQWVPPSALSGRGLVFLLLSGLATGASWLCYFRALSLGEVSRVAPIDKLSVVLAALLGVLFLGERVSLLHGAGIALIAAGAILVAWP